MNTKLIFCRGDAFRRLFSLAVIVTLVQVVLLPGVVAHAQDAQLNINSVSQSSTEFGGYASNAVDGNTNGRFSNRSTTHTKSEAQPSWTADLGVVANISEITIWNRIDSCCTTRLANFYVLVSPTPFTSNSLAVSLDSASVWSKFSSGSPGATLTVPVNASGRYIRIQLRGTNALSLAEVKVNGTVSNGGSGAGGALAASPDTANVASGESVSINVLSNDTGPVSGAAIETNVSPQARRGWLRVNQASGVITYNAYIGQSGTDTFGYRLRSNGVLSNATVVTVNIGTDVPVGPRGTNPLNSSPVAANDSATVSAQNSTTINVLSNDNDTDGSLNRSSVVITQSPSRGSTSVRSDGSIQFIANAVNSATTDRFQYTVRDNDGAVSNAAVVTVFIAPVNVPPVSTPVTSGGLTAAHRNGQTFITWAETAAQDGYHVYRHSAPITPSSLNSARKLTARWGALNSETSVNKFGGPNAPNNYVISDLAPPLGNNTGLFVYTTQPGDSSSAYYAVTSVRNGAELRSTLKALTGSIRESVSQPRDVLTLSVNNGKGRMYTQYMDYSQWNPTFNGYAYSYSVALPFNYNSNRSYPLQIQLHAYGEIYKFKNQSEYNWDVIQLFPHDPGGRVGGINSWWYGYAADHDYTTGATPNSGRIANFTEQRVMRSVQELITNRDINVDEQLIHAYGHSMGGSGVLSLGIRYGSVISGIFASEPMTNYGNSSLFVSELERIWGNRSSALRTVNSGPYSGSIQAYNNRNVWDWMNHQKQLVERRGDTFAYLMTLHGKRDNTIAWDTQGRPLVRAFTQANAGFSANNQNVGHSWYGFSGVVRSLFGFESSTSFRWKYPLALSYPAIQNASGSSAITPPNSGTDNYNLNIEWATAHTPFDTNIVDLNNRYEITIRSTTANQTADITPRRTSSFRVNAGRSCRWTATNRNNQSQIASGNVTADSDALLTVRGFPIVTGTGTRLLLNCE